MSCYSYHLSWTVCCGSLCYPRCSCFGG